MSDDLARRAIACKHWRWMPGMLTLEEVVPPAITLGWDAARVLHADEGDAVRVCTVLRKVRDIHDTALPDLTDPPTLGCLLALVREAWGDSDIYFGSSLSTKRKRWSWVMGGGDCIGQGDTEAEALLATLEAAP